MSVGKLKLSFLTIIYSLGPSVSFVGDSTLFHWDTFPLRLISMPWLTNDAAKAWIGEEGAF